MRIRHFWNNLQAEKDEKKNQINNTDAKKIKVLKKNTNSLLQTNWRTGLPKVLMEHILFGYHRLNEAKNFAKASDEAKEAYKNPFLLSRFIKYVAKGEQKQADYLLKANPNFISYLLSHKTHVKDFSGKIFINVTAFQYTLWALDRHMWNMLMKYFKARSLDEEAAKQLLEFEKYGVEYQLPLKAATEKPETKKERHYDFAVITALQNYVNVCNEYFAHPPTKTYHDIELACLQLRHVQCYVPAHIANEYCRRDRSFLTEARTAPDFKDENLPRTFLLNYPNSLRFPLDDDGLNKSAVFRGDWRGAAQYKGEWMGALDLTALTTLYNVRVLEYAQLKESLCHLLDLEKDSMPTAPSLRS